MPLGFWGELVRLGVLVPREAQEMAAAEEFLWRVRNRLHAHAGRRSDRLTFDEQESLALAMGYGNDDDPRERATAAERFMQDYYLHARAVTRGRERILLRATPAKKRGKPIEVDLGHGIRLFDGQVTIAGVQELSMDPALALRAYAACIRHSAPLLPFAREAIARAASDPAWCVALRASPEAGPLFTDLICTVAEGKTRRGSIAGELHDVGLLLAMIPEFAPVTGRVHHDVYHVYTVDVHSVAALDSLRSMCRGELTQERPLATRLAAEIARPKPLFLATLLHDVGKGYPDASGSRKNHSQSGAELCDVILPRLGFSPEDTLEARHLISQHLAMYHVATRRDLDDPATIEEFCRLVRGREGLRDLFLLTVVDLSTTSPTAMTSWKARMLDELYFAADAHLAGAKDGAFDEARLARVREAARLAWAGDRAFLEAFLASMPERYLLANAPESIAAHAGVALDRGGATVHAAIVPSRHPEFAEVCVVAEDRPGLLARIAAAITAGRLEVLAAQVYSRASRRAGKAGRAPDRGGGPLLGARPHRRPRGDRARDAAADPRPQRRLLRRDRSRGAPPPAHRHVVAVARAPEPRGAHGGGHRRARVAAAHGRRGLRQGPPRPPLYDRARAPRARALDRPLEDQHGGDEGRRRFLRERARRSEGRPGRTAQTDPRHDHPRDRRVTERDERLDRRARSREDARMKTWFATALRGSLRSRRSLACGGAPPAREGQRSSLDAAAPSVRLRPLSSGNADYDQGVTALARGDVDGAKGSWKRIHDRDPKDGAGSVLLGLIDEKQGDKAGAEKAYREAIKLRPDLEAAYVNLSALLIDQQRNDDALTVARAGLAKFPSSAGLHANVGTALATQGDQAGASGEFDQATRAATADPMLLMTYAHWLGVWKQSEASLTKLRAARALTKDVGVLAAIGEEMKGLGAFADCVPTFDQAIGLKDAPELRTYRAVCKLGMKDADGAKTDLQAAIAGQYAPAHFYLARVLGDSGDWKGAVGEYETFLKLEPNVPASKVAREKLKQAKEHLKK